MAIEKKKVNYLKWLFVVVIIGLIAALMIPSFVNKVEKERSLLAPNLDQYDNPSDEVRGNDEQGSELELRKMYRDLMIENLELRDSLETLKEKCL